MSTKQKPAISRYAVFGQLLRTTAAVSLWECDGDYAVTNARGSAVYLESIDRAVAEREYVARATAQAEGK